MGECERVGERRGSYIDGCCEFIFAARWLWCCCGGAPAPFDCECWLLVLKDVKGSGMPSVDASWIVPAGLRERCDANRFRRREGGTSGLAAGLESANVGDTDGS